MSGYLPWVTYWRNAKRLCKDNPKGLVAYFDTYATQQERTNRRDWAKEVKGL